MKISETFTIKEIAEVRYSLERRLDYLYREIKEMEKDILNDPDSKESPEFYARYKECLFSGKLAFFKISGYAYSFDHIIL